ncbi:MAG: hypothetical protein HEP71_00700 [Roseivirga sp.]|nr:hypothetical protein [Roseivirga sp.]
MTTKDSLNQNIWKAMQQRIENIRKRQVLVTKAKELGKTQVILKLQVENQEQKSLDGASDLKRIELKNRTNELRQIQAEYMKLAGSEMDILTSNLKRTISQIESSGGCDVDLEDRRFSLQQALWKVQHEMDEVTGKQN